MLFKSNLQNNFQIATAIRDTFKKGYTLSIFKKDLFAGLLVALITLPLSMALAITVGLPPENGVYAAIVAGIIVPLLGGSHLQVTGPTAAFVVILAPIVAELGVRGLIWCQIIAGIFLLIMGFSRIGKYINYIPYPVTTGFSLGISVIVVALALENFLGLKLPEYDGDFIHRIEDIWSEIPRIHYYDLGVGIFSLLLIIAFTRYNRFIPALFVGVLGGSILSYILNKNGFSIATIQSSFTYAENLSIKKGIPSDLPVLHFFNFREGDIFAIPTLSELKLFIMPAIVITALAALESLLSATVADSMAGTKHNSNAELNALGIGNIVSGFAMGIPATGAIARTAANINAGAKSPVAAIIHGIFLIILIRFFTPLINYIPMSALSAALLFSAYRMSQLRQCLRIFFEAPRSDIIILVTCFMLTVFVDMVAGITVGISLASLLFMKSVAEITNIKLESKKAKDGGKKYDLLDDVMVYNIDGPLFFGSVQKAYHRSHFVNDKIKTVIINMEHVPYIDISGLMAIKSLINTLTQENKRVVLVGNKKITGMILRKTPFGINVNNTDNIKISATLSKIISRYQPVLTPL